MSTHLLAIDAGNTRTKWAVIDHAGLLLSHGVFMNHALPQTLIPADWHTCNRVIHAHVADIATAEHLQRMLVSLNVPLKPAVVTARICDVSNGYDHPAQLGIDRWAALVAAWQRYRAACIVVNAGTAITIDALAPVTSSAHEQGAFIGGLIMPGLALMRSSLAHGTAALTNLKGNLAVFPVNTGDAIQSGALQAAAGAIRHMRDELQQRQHHKPHLILGGGDAYALASVLQNAVTADAPVIIEHLVLEGLYLLERDMP